MPRSIEDREYVADQPRTLGEAMARHLQVVASCQACHRHIVVAQLSADHPWILHYGADMTLVEMQRRARCRKCGVRGSADVYAEKSYGDARWPTHDP